jgi:nucleoside triphosphatase
MSGNLTFAQSPGVGANSTFDTRLIVVPIIKDEAGRTLLCKMPPDRGVFPGQWGLSGGGVERGERIEEALKREIREELDVEIDDAIPLFFKDGLYEKTFPNGSKNQIYMLFLIFESRLAASQTINLNGEFCEYAWVKRSELADYDLNTATQDTFARLGLLTAPAAKGAHE